MKSELHLWPKPTTLTLTEATLSVEVDMAGAAPQTLWYRVPQQYQDWLSPNQDPFVVATLLWAMRQADALIIHGTVSPTLLRNLERFQEIWSTWQPHRYKLIPVEADHEQELPPIAVAEQRAISSFSGGVDSSYTVARHRRMALGRRRENLGAGLMIHGLDIPLDKPDAFRVATQRAEGTLASVGMALVTLVTNWRSVVEVPWEEGFGTAVAAGLMVLQGHCQVGLIASGRSYDRLKMPWGSTPLSDRECSSGAMTIRHDGADRDRMGKIAALTDWPEALENLRVCWQGPKKDENCCRCEKCIRTMLAFRVLGVDRPRCFPREVSNDQIRRIRLRGTALEEMVLVHRQASQGGNTDSWVGALGHALQRNRILNQVDRVLSPTWRQRLKILRPE